ncbi:MAG: nitroreductase family protein [Muribaculaceae bacterium]|nr:nitroreductase family protein [Muribaculaceae bacterium]
MNDFFKNRRTIRKYSSQNVSDELLRDIIEQASHAPTTGNMQLYSVVVTRTKEGKERLLPMHFNQPSVAGCSVLLTFCADFNRFEKWCEASDAVPGYNNFQSFITAFLDTAIFAQQFCTIAEMYGLGCCYLGTTTYNAPQIAQELNLPDRVVPVTTLTVGYPDGDVLLSDRIPVAGLIHNEKYVDFSSDEIKLLYSEKEAREDSCRFVAENGKSSLAQVFTDVRYTREANEHFSKIYKDFIESKGFAI